MAAPAATAKPKINKLKYQTIFPQYVDATLTKSLGRRLTGTQSVAHPTLEEMFHALTSMGFRDIFVDPTKSLPCAQSQPHCVPPPRGCIKVAIKELASEVADGAERKSVNANAGNKSEVLRQMASKIKAIPDRKVQEQTFAQKQAAASAEATAEYMSKTRKTKMPGQKMKVVRRGK